MRKFFLFLLLLLLLVPAGGYCLMWYLQSMQLKMGAEQVIARINEPQKIFTYEKLEVSGFPTDLHLDIVQPRFSARMNQLLLRVEPLLQKDGLAPDEEQWLNAIKALPEWTEEVAAAGNIRITVNMFSDLYSVNFSGPTTQISTIAGNRVTLINSPAGQQQCSLTLARNQQWFTAMWDIGRVIRSPEQLLADFRRFECTLPGSTATDDATKETLVSSGPVTFSLSHRLDTVNRAVGIVFKVQDYEAKPGFDAFATRYLQLFSGVSGVSKSSTMAQRGKQQADVQLALMMPIDPINMGGKPFSLSVPQFTIQNALENHAGKVDISNKISGDQRDVNVMIDLKSSFTPLYDEHLTTMVRDSIRDIMESQDPSLAQFKAMLAPYTAEQAMDLLKPLIVRLSDLGTVTAHTDLHMTGDQTLQKGTLDIKGIEFSTTSYGVMLAGKAGLTGDAQGLTPDSLITLSCRNCSQLISDLGSYVQRVETVMFALMPTPPDANGKAQSVKPLVTHELLQAIQTFAYQLGEAQKDSSGAELLLFKLGSAAGGIVTINGKPMDQVVLLYGQTVAPYVQAPPPVVVATPPSASHGPKPALSAPPAAAVTPPTPAVPATPAAPEVPAVPATPAAPAAAR